MAETNLSIIISLLDKASPEFKKLATNVNQAKKNIEKISKGGSTSKIKKDTSDAAKEMGRLQAEAIKANKQFDRMRRSVNPLSSNFAKATVSAETLAQSISNSRGQLLATAAVASGLFLSIKRATDEFLKLEGAIAEVSTLVDSARISNEELTASVVELSNEYGTNAAELAKALYQAISAGAQAGTEANELLAVSIQTAIGGVTNVDTAVDGLTTIVNAFGFEVSDARKVSDILFTTMKNGKTTIEELSERFFQLAPVANAMGVSLEDSSAALIALTKQGTPTRVAMTQIRAALTGFARNNPEVKKAFRDIGFESFKTAVAAQGLGKTFEDLNELTDGSIGKLQKLTGSIEGVQAVLGTTGDQARFFAEGWEQVNNATGATLEAFEKMRDSLDNQLKVALNEILNAVIAFGTAAGPTFILLVKTIALAAKAVTAFIETLRNLGRADILFGGLITLVTLATAVFTALVVVAGFVLVAFKELAPVVIFLNSGLTGTAAKAGAVSAGLGFLGASAGTAAAGFKLLIASVKGLSLVFALIAGSQLVAASILDIREAADAAADAIESLTIITKGLSDLGTGRIGTDLVDALKLAANGTKKEIDNTIDGLKERREDLEDVVNTLLVSSRLKGVDRADPFSKIKPEKGETSLGLLKALEAGAENLVGTFDALRLATIDSFQPGFLANLDKAEQGVVSLSQVIQILEEKSKTLNTKGELAGLARPFEEMENAIKAANKLFQELDNIKLSSAEKEINRITDAQIEAAKLQGNPLAETAIRDEAFDELTKRQEEFNKEELARNENQIAQLELNIRSADETTVEQERRTTDRLNKLQATNVKIRIKQAKDEANTLIKEINRITKAQIANAQARTDLAKQATEDAQTIKDALTAIDDARAVERGRDETVVQRRRLQAQLSELQDLQRRIVENEGQVEQSVRDRVEQLSDTIIQGGQALGTSGGFLNAVRGRNFIKAVDESQKEISKVSLTALEKQEKELRESLFRREEEFKAFGNRLEQLRLEAKVILAVDDTGLTDFQRAVLDSVVEAERQLNIKPTIDLTEFEENIETLSKVIVKSVEPLTLGIAPSGLEAQVPAIADKLKEAAESGEKIEKAVAGSAASLLTAKQDVEVIAKAFDNKDSLGKTFFSDIKVTDVKKVTDIFGEAVTGDIIRSAFEAMLTGVATDFQKKLVEVLNSLGFGLNVSASSAPGFSGGGHVKGPGTSTSDSIAARLSNNEFVVQARAVQKYGAGLFHELNSLSFRNLPKFASGGLVQTRIPTPSTSSEIQRDVVDLNFNIGGQKIQLQGRRDQVAALTRATRQLQSTLIGG